MTETQTDSVYRLHEKSLINTSWKVMIWNYISIHLHGHAQEPLIIYCIEIVIWTETDEQYVMYIILVYLTVLMFTTFICYVEVTLFWLLP